jgi:hypothetical protein
MTTPRPARSPRRQARRRRGASMTREEWNEVLAIAPLTPAQRGAVHGEFTRLSIVGRTERLGISAALLGLRTLGSTSDLTQGQAGKLIARLRDIRNRNELAAVLLADDEDPDADDNSQLPGPGWVALIARWLNADRRETPD